MIRILHVDENHPTLLEGLTALGCQNTLNTTATKEEIESEIEHYHGLVIRSRFPIDSTFLNKAASLKFIARIGSGLENIDVKAAEKLGIAVLAAPEGNSPSVGEHALGMLLSLFNKIPKADAEIRNGIWQREANRGEELAGKTIGIIGYGHTGKQFAKKLSGFDVTVLYHDILLQPDDSFAIQVPLKMLKEKADVVSLHLPLDETTYHYVNQQFISEMKKPFWLINTARGNQVVTTDLVKGLQDGKVKGACLDVLDKETAAFEVSLEQSADWSYLSQHPSVVLSPHVAGWTVQSLLRLSEVMLSKIRLLLNDENFKKS